MNRSKDSSAPSVFNDGRALKAGAAARYGRLSTEEYKTRSFSVERQCQAISEFCVEYPSDFSGREIRDYQDIGKSGKNFNRPGINRLRNDITAGLISCVFVRDLRRLGRNAKEGLEFLDLCNEHGVIIIDISQPSVDFTSTAGRKIFTDGMSNAESERGTHLENSIQGQTDRAREGKWKGGPAPAGYLVKDGYLKLCDAQSSMMTRFFALVKLNHSPISILSSLQKEGITTRPVNRRQVDGTLVTEQCPINLKWIRDTLDNPAYAGYVPAPRVTNHLTRNYKPHLLLPDGRRYFESLHPQYISREDWHALRAKRQTGHTPSGCTGRDAPAAILQGLLRCGCCEHENLNVGASTSEHGKVSRQYVCQDLLRIGHSSKCTVRRIPAQASETAVIRFCELLAQNPEMIGGVVAALGKNKHGVVADLESRERDISVELAKVQRQKKTIVDRLVEYGNTALGDAIQTRFNEADQREAVLRMQLAELREMHASAGSALPSRDSIADALAAFEKTLSQAPAAKVKEIVRLLVHEITVTSIDHPNTPCLAHLPASSRVLKFDLSLSPIGIHYSNSPALAQRWSEAGKKTSERKAKLSVTFEIRRNGNKGNMVNLLEPAFAEAKIVDFTKSGCDTMQPESTPLTRLDDIQRDLAKGMKKKDVAAKLGKTPAWISQHLRLTALSPRIVKALADAPASAVASFGLVRLMKIAAMPGRAQQEAAFDLEYRRALNGPVTNRRAVTLILTSPERRTEMIAQFKASGLSMVAFAKQHGVKYPTFAGWIASERRSSGSGNPATSE